MTKNNFNTYYHYLNPHALTLLDEYKKSKYNKMWATCIILSLTIIDNILSDENYLNNIDGLSLNKVKGSTELMWLRKMRNKILHYNSPVDGFYGTRDSVKILKLNADRADKILKLSLKELSR